MSPGWSVKKTQTQNHVLSAVSGMHYSCRQLSLHAYSCPMCRRWGTLRVEENRRPTPNSRALQVLKFYSWELLIEATPPPHLSTGKNLGTRHHDRNCFKNVRRCDHVPSIPVPCYSLPPPTVLACILQITVVCERGSFLTRGRLPMELNSENVV